MKLLPLFLQIGKTYDLPVLLPGCRRLKIRELIYKNKKEENLIIECRLSVNERVVEFKKTPECDQTFFVNGVKGSTLTVDLESDKNNICLTVTCRNFNLCHCKSNRFQLNLEAECDT